MTDNQILLYQSDDGEVQIEVTSDGETVWLNQAQMASLFQTERSVITKHIKNVFKSGQLDEESNVQKMHITGSDKPVQFYNLEVIISVGYRVNSYRGVQFRIWATKTLREYIIKASSWMMTGWQVGVATPSTSCSNVFVAFGHPKPIIMKK